MIQSIHTRIEAAYTIEHKLLLWLTVLIVRLKEEHLIHRAHVRTGTQSLSEPQRPVHSAPVPEWFSGNIAPQYLPPRGTWVANEFTLEEVE